MEVSEEGWFTELQMSREQVEVSGPEMRGTGFKINLKSLT